MRKFEIFNLPYIMLWWSDHRGWGQDR